MMKYIKENWIFFAFMILICIVGGYFTTIYTCPWEEGKDYTLKDNTCYEIILHPPYNYSCSEGVLEGKQCKIITEEKDYTLTCEAGYKYNKKCKVCEKE